ncbi:alpha/beta-Hydrolases superfamily protein [Trifolium repens]|nr:alpha/beta-Hydrolases superfamily protein [Trifolium repens]
MRCRGSDSFPQALIILEPSEICAAIFTMLPRPISSIFLRCSKSPTYSEHIQSDGFTNRLGIQADKASNES